MEKARIRSIVYFYRKDGCHLCDDMARGLVEFRQELDPGIEFEIVERDIEDEKHWYQRYREYVPVLVLNHQEICHYFLDKDELRSALQCN